MKTLIIFLVCLGTVLSAAVKRQECKTNADCQATECCAEEPNPFMVSKRDVLKPIAPELKPIEPVLQPIDLWKPKKYCYSYLQENEWCAQFHTTCGCASGFTCQDTLLNSLIAVSKRDIRPGDWRCTKQ